MYLICCKSTVVDFYRNNLAAMEVDLLITFWSRMETCRTS